MDKFNIQQLTFMRKLGDVLKFSYDIDVVNYHAKRNIKTLVKCAENFYNYQIENIAQEIIKHKTKIVLLSGPSSCGKTTSSIRIQKELAKKKIKAQVISMDDFFVNKLDTPLAPDGTFDFENVTAVDIPCFKKFIKDILTKNKASLPSYDFIQGIRSGYSDITLEKNQVLLIEGIHALNPIFIKDVAKKQILKVFVSVSSQFISGSEVLISSQKLRLMRRILRDFYKRNTPIEETLSWWKKVRSGESLYILPYRSTADIILNTTHMFEPLLYDKYLQPILKEHSSNEIVKDLLLVFEKTGSMDKSFLPKHSLAWEFLPSDEDLEKRFGKQEN